MLTEGSFIDGMILATLAKRLLTPFRDWDAYRLGIIDSDGKKKRDPETSREKDAYSLLNRFLIKIRKSLGERTLQSLAAFYLLLRDHKETIEIDKNKILEEYEHEQKLEKSRKKIRDYLIERDISEEEYYNYLTEIVLKRELDCGPKD